jgi:hypothetical protein
MEFRDVSLPAIVSNLECTPNAAQRCLYDPIKSCLDVGKAGGKLAFWGAIFGSVEVGAQGQP